jgi:hypothetical protein
MNHAAALALAVVALLVLAGLIGDLLPMLAFIAAAAFDVLIFRHASSRTGHVTMTGGMWLLLLLPLATAVAVKMLRGDRRGATGSWRRS